MTAPEPALTRREIQKMVDIVMKQAKGGTLMRGGDKPYPSYHDQIAYPKDYSVPKFKQFNGL